MSRGSRRLRRYAVPISLGRLLGLALLLTGCAAATLGDKLGTSVTAADRTVTLTWTPDHSWDGTLAGRGAQLFAEYRTERSGLVREALANARAGNSRTLNFPLPEALRAQPIGPVCLFIQPNGMQGLLPVRKAASPGADTARFRYIAWETDSTQRTQQRIGDRRTQTLRTELAKYDGEILKREGTLAARGLAQPAACETIQTATSSAAMPADVLPPAQHDAAARRVCVHRIWVSRRFVEIGLARHSESPSSKTVDVVTTRLAKLAHAVPALADRVLKDPPAGNSEFAQAVQQRQSQAREFLADMQRWQSQIGPGYEPPLGAFDEYLALSAYAGDLQAKLIQSGSEGRLGFDPSMAALSARDRLGLVGANLDAYFLCVEDGRKQLATKSDAWLALQRESPDRNRLRREFFVQECRGEHRRLQDLRDERDKLRADIAGIESQPNPSSGLQSSAAPRELNFVTCD